MESTTIIIVIAAVLAVVAAIVGLLVGRSITQKSNRDIEAQAQLEVDKKLTDAKATADKLVADAQRNAENIKKDKQLEAKEYSLELKRKHEAEVAERNKKVLDKEAQIKQQQTEVQQRTAELNKKEKEVETVRENLNKQLEQVSQKNEQLKKSHDIFVSKLEQISNLTKEDAKKELVESMKKEAEADGQDQRQDAKDHQVLDRGQPEAVAPQPLILVEFGGAEFPEMCARELPKEDIVLLVATIDAAIKQTFTPRLEIQLARVFPVGAGLGLGQAFPQ